MAHFPNDLADKATNIECDLGNLGNAAISRIHDKGYTVATGLTEYYAGSIALMACQPHIQEYCPSDSTEARFGTLGSTRQWLQHDGGRGFFLLLEGRGDTGRLAGYGWAGVKHCDHLPDHPITSAYRIGQKALGKGLAKDFIQVVVSGTHAMYSDGEGIGLETWESNRAAALYYQIGFTLLFESTEYELRPTLANEGGVVLDRRLFMGYPSELLPRLQ